MTTKDHLVEQHILEYESRLKHIDELIEKAHTKIQGGSGMETAKTALEEIKSERIGLDDHLSVIKAESGPATSDSPDISTRVGPLEVWDNIAEQLEKLVEHLDKNQ